MRIGIVLSRPPAYSETFFTSKIKGLQENGMEVLLFCQRMDEDFKLCPVIVSPKVSRNPFIQLWYFSKVFFSLLPHFNAVINFIKLEIKEKKSFVNIVKGVYLNAHLLKAKLDWLHFGFATLALGSETVAKAIGAQMAVSFRGFDMAVYPVKHPGCFNMLWSYVDNVHTISTDLLALAQGNGLPRDIPVYKITPAIDVNFFEASRQELKTHNIIFMTTGRLHWKKGFVFALEALALLKSKGIEFTYKIIGEGPDFERIAFAAYQLGLKDNVKFLGKLPHPQVKEHLKTAHIYLQYSIQEGFCNAVLEAQAMGKLCIVSNAEGLSENILHKKTGWVVPKYNPQALAETISTVLGLNNEEMKTIIQNAQKRVREEFNIEKQQSEFISFYKK